MQRWRISCDTPPPTFGFVLACDNFYRSVYASVAAKPIATEDIACVKTQERCNACARSNCVVITLACASNIVLLAIHTFDLHILCVCVVSSQYRDLMQR